MFTLLIYDHFNKRDHVGQVSIFMFAGGPESMAAPVGVVA
jgi:hypothetical protein